MPLSRIPEAHLDASAAEGGGSRYDPDRHGPRRVVGPRLRDRDDAVVAQVPSGAVTTYGDGAPSARRRHRLRREGTEVTPEGRMREFARRRHVIGS